VRDTHAEREGNGDEGGYQAYTAGGVGYPVAHGTGRSNVTERKRVMAEPLADQALRKGVGNPGI